MTECLLSHHLPRREGASSHLDFAAGGWFRAPGFELFKPQFVPQEQGRSGHPFPAIPSETLKTHNLALNIPCGNLVQAKE